VLPVGVLLAIRQREAEWLAPTRVECLPWPEQMAGCLLVLAAFLALPLVLQLALPAAVLPGQVVLEAARVEAFLVRPLE
jgi:hypothetical protein